MSARPLMVITALLTLAAVSTNATAAEPVDAKTPTTAPAAKPLDDKAPPRRTEERYTDGAGNQFVLRFDGKDRAKPQVRAIDKKGNPIKLVTFALNDMQICVPRGEGAEQKPLCQPVQYISDNTILKFGTGTCTCYYYNNASHCFGSPCP
jgi:hypothetical protein